MSAPLSLSRTHTPARSASTDEKKRRRERRRRKRCEKKRKEKKKSIVVKRSRHGDNVQGKGEDRGGDEGEGDDGGTSWSRCNYDISV